MGFETIIKELMGKDNKTFYNRMSNINKFSLLGIGIYVGKFMFGIVPKNTFMIDVLIVTCLIGIMTLSNQLTYKAVTYLVKDHNDKDCLEIRTTTNERKDKENV